MESSRARAQRRCEGREASSMTTALVTGITGQDGSYLAEYLVGQGYKVYGLVRCDPGPTSWLCPISDRIELVRGDLRDEASLDAVFQRAWPDEVYNLAGQSSVPASWEVPDQTFDINVGGLARLLNIVARHRPDTRVYQASSADVFGNAEGCCNEETPLRPTSPYGISKMAAHRLCDAYRRKGIYVVSGILFNHESPRRRPEMVTRKVTRAAAAWAHGDRTKVKLGDLEARRDWGFAGDYVRAMHAMLQQPAPRDYVLGTGKSHSVADFVAQALVELRAVKGDEFALPTLAEFVEVDPRLLRVGEIRDSRADAAQARQELGWEPDVDFPGLVRMMVQADVDALA
jgi:GDPmannose 4,6-dehydratase